MKKIGLFAIIALIVGTLFVFSRQVQATQVRVEKSVVVNEACDGTADITVNAGNTNRNWRVNNVEHWLSFGQSYTWEGVPADSVIEWWHNSEQLWKVVNDEDYVRYNEAKDCPPTMSDVPSCGLVELTFKNPTPWFFSFDYQVDGEVGHDDEVTGLNIAKGPWAGQPFGQRYQEVDVLSGQTVVVPVNFTEDSGNHTVRYRLWRGAENNLYLDWVEVNVKSDCNPNGEPDPWDCSKDNSCKQEATAPVCTDGTVLALPANSHVMRKGSEAIIKWVPTGGNLVDIYYKENDQSGWTHAKGDQPNNGENKVELLNPNLGYTFGIRQHQGCGGGETVTVVIIDPPSTIWKLFPMNYWTWN